MYRQKVVCYIYDDPVDFKKLKIYPVKVSEYLDFYNYIDCLQIDKNSVPDVNVISMSYLDYLISISDGSNYYSSKMILLLKLCLHLRDFAIITEDEARVIYESGKNLLLSKLESPEKDEDVIVINRSGNKSWDEISKIIKDEFPDGMFYFDEGDIIQIVKKKNKSMIQIKDGFYSSEDFDEIKKIILEQNMVDMPDERIRKSTRDKLDKKLEIQNKIQKSTKSCGFEDLLVCVSIGAHLTLEEVNSLTLRKFNKYIKRINAKLTYEVFKPPILSGSISSKDESFPLDWMADLESEDKYDRIFVKEEEVKNKIEK